MRKAEQSKFIQSLIRNARVTADKAKVLLHGDGRPLPLTRCPTTRVWRAESIIDSIDIVAISRIDLCDSVLALDCDSIYATYNSLRCFCAGLTVVKWLYRELCFAFLRVAMRLGLWKASCVDLRAV
jgi:hypothetical protein